MSGGKKISAGHPFNSCIGEAAYDGNRLGKSIFFGDNLEILKKQYIPMASVDLVYLDPPFNSKASYNVLFAEKSGESSAAQITRLKTPGVGGWNRSISSGMW